jgi:DNA polymerase
MVKMDQRRFLFGIQSLLRYQQQLGIRSYVNNDQLQCFLRYHPQVSPASEKMRSEKSAIPAIEQATPAPASPSSSPVLTLAELEQEINVCRACDLSGLRLYPVPGRGIGKARLMIVGDWLVQASTTKNGNQRQLFGEEQDLMLSRMLKAISLSIENVFITNVIKCGLSLQDQPQATHVQICSSYLFRQIEIVQPELICAMGVIAARCLLGKSQPLSKMRGRLHSFIPSKGNKIPVLPTYHPTYLLQNPEMKKAAWADLQLAARTLNLRIRA